MVMELIQPRFEDPGHRFDCGPAEESGSTFAKVIRQRRVTGERIAITVECLVRETGFCLGRRN